MHKYSFGVKKFVNVSAGFKVKYLVHVYINYNLCHWYNFKQISYFKKIKKKPKNIKSNVVWTF